MTGLAAKGCLASASFALGCLTVTVSIALFCCDVCFRAVDA